MTFSLRFRVAGALALALPAAAGCHRARNRESSPSPDGYFITAERIAASGASTAWDALRLTVPVLDFRENGRGTPTRIVRRGRGSINLDDSPIVWVDNNRVFNIRDLDLMPAADIESIRVLSPLDAATYYGGGSTTGVILIKTKTGS